MRKRAQSILEYAVLISVVSIALMAMQQYVYRAMNAKLKEVQDEVYEQPRLGSSGVQVGGSSAPSSSSK